MWVGYTLADRQLEVGIEYMSNGVDHIYHCRKASSETTTKAVYSE
jgi:hypothetical protein